MFTDWSPSDSTYSLAEHLDAGLVIAERIEEGTNSRIDDLTLLAHLRVMREDFCEPDTADPPGSAPPSASTPHVSHGVLEARDG